MGLARASVGIGCGPEAIYSNPGGLASIQRPSVALSCGYQFGIPELLDHAGCVCVPARGGCFSLALATYGFELYRETTACLGYGRSLFQGLAAGLTLKGCRLHVQRFGSANAVSLDAGLTGRGPRSVAWGLAAWNLLGTRLAEEQLSRSLSLGMALGAGDRSTIYVGARKQERQASQFGCGIEYDLAPRLAVRTGVGNEPTRFAAGLGVRLGAFRLDYGLNTHLVLGLSHYVSLVVR